MIVLENKAINEEVSDRSMRLMERITPGIKDGVAKYTAPHVNALNKIHSDDLGDYNLIDQSTLKLNQLE
ncbi:hypothetical protein AKO1_010216 [Acrasis kona]|uniref:Uncharacterized protein n=1 Tax=Acrasis kona TaxID=1008807 RepID=A0AAW2ZRS9_9EUKA